MNEKTSSSRAPQRPSSKSVPRSPTPADADRSGPVDAPLPSERDEGGNSTDGIPSEKIQQAHQDVKRGLSDTSRGEASDAAYQKQKQK